MLLPWADPPCRCSVAALTLELTATSDHPQTCSAYRHPRAPRQKTRSFEDGASPKPHHPPTEAASFKCPVQPAGLLSANRLTPCTHTAACMHAHPEHPCCVSTRAAHSSQPPWESSHAANILARLNPTGLGTSDAETLPVCTVGTPPLLCPTLPTAAVDVRPAPSHPPPTRNSTAPCAAGMSASGRSVSASARVDACSPRGGEAAQGQDLVSRHRSLEPWHLDRHSRREPGRPEKLRGSWQPPRSLSGQVRRLAPERGGARGHGPDVGIGLDVEASGHAASCTGHDGLIRSGSGAGLLGCAGASHIHSTAPHAAQIRGARLGARSCGQGRACVDCMRMRGIRLSRMLRAWHKDLQAACQVAKLAALNFRCWGPRSWGNHLWLPQRSPWAAH